jgi:hypothetical protein
MCVASNHLSIAANHAYTSMPRTCLPLNVAGGPAATRRCCANIAAAAIELSCAAFACCARLAACCCICICISCCSATSAASPLADAITADSCGEPDADNWGGNGGANAAPT